MSNQHYFFKMNQLVEYLKMDYPGTAEELAGKLDVSRRTLFRYLEELRIHGAEIEYCKKRNAYNLKNEFDFLENFFKSAL